MPKIFDEDWARFVVIPKILPHDSGGGCEWEFWNFIICMQTLAATNVAAE